ncbi:MAG: hypothetical protein ACFB9M_03205 [Myxococcota bacterium]
MLRGRTGNVSKCMFLLGVVACEPAELLPLLPLAVEDAVPQQNAVLPSGPVVVSLSFSESVVPSSLSASASLVSIDSTGAPIMSFALEATVVAELGQVFVLTSEPVEGPAQLVLTLDGDVLTAESGVQLANSFTRTFSVTP